MPYIRDFTVLVFFSMEQIGAPLATVGSGVPGVSPGGDELRLQKGTVSGFGKW